jgi:hypothetical protein
MNNRDQEPGYRSGNIGDVMKSTRFGDFLRDLFPSMFRKYETFTGTNFNGNNEYHLRRMVARDTTSLSGLQAGLVRRLSMNTR